MFKEHDFTHLWNSGHFRKVTNDIAEKYSDNFRIHKYRNPNHLTFFCYGLVIYDQKKVKRVLECLWHHKKVDKDSRIGHHTRYSIEPRRIFPLWCPLTKLLLQTYLQYSINMTLKGTRFHGLR